MKYGQTATVSEEVLASGQETAEAMHRWMSATPQERAEWAAEAERERAKVRATAAFKALTLDALLARVQDWGWSREYVEHLVQPYCTCEDGRDGWEFCQHARDLGLTP